MSANGDILYVLCAADEKYMPYCGVMITSLFFNNQDIDMMVYVLTDYPVSKKEQRRLRKLELTYHQHIKVLIVDKSKFENYPARGMSYWSVAMYYRLLAAELLPGTVDRVLYLDCDVIVTGSLKWIQEINIDNYAVGAVVDICFYDKSINKRLHYPSTFSYFNSGVLLLNLRYWRDNDIQSRCLEFLHKNYNLLSANDQDVLNAVLYDKTFFFPISYNYQVQFRKQDLFIHYSTQMQHMIIGETKPLIIHFAMPIKPWDILYYRLPFEQVWKFYKRHSKWWMCIPVLPKHYWFKCIIKRYILWPIGIMYNWPGKDY